ncbi:SOUL family heme-binding protein [Clavibacter sepedonicus]|uniref:Haem-binding protein n=1 Tax=Clavibacter sepedonicus TaxID=31964 RepID=B0RBC1_CLASE|nr:MULTISPECIES: heme-binding protein [Clavibacter]MBD5380909.1 heme-binding protein [Clavibacter sp.]OQJ47350.1 heme-binding protein [Clavibacter sepedonicus]OQJ52906.1 heme-binding protein [Clavibacter sepedonicus]UUK66905.1 heme-binding protein [Clavibacter sepedonicus]CAQ01662.1 putative haem-binding protein [Clavibacter sepedonicus]
MTEQQPYTVVREESSFQVRRYPEHVVAEVTVRADFDAAGNTAFRALFGYISGANAAGGKVAMTAPVVQAPVSQEIAMAAPVVQTAGQDAGSHVVAFVLPSTFTEATAPAPTSPEVSLRTVPEALVAATTYSGRWTRARYDERCEELIAALAEASITTLSAPRFARFDPPYKPWFLRRNEVLIDVAG